MRRAIVGLAAAMIFSCPALAKKKGGPPVPSPDASLGTIAMRCSGNVSNPSREINQQLYTAGIVIL